MTTLHFTEKIQATPGRVWHILWNDKWYRQWVSAFEPGSYAQSDWKEGSRILFLGGQDGSGMFATIEKTIPEKLMRFRHEGEIKNGIEQPLSDPTKEWAGAIEEYTLSGNDGYTELNVSVDVPEEFAPVFQSKFPVALAMVKTLSEK